MEFNHVPRSNNAKAYILVNLGVNLEYGEKVGEKTIFFLPP